MQASDRQGTLQSLTFTTLCAVLVASCGPTPIDGSGDIDGRLGSDGDPIAASCSSDLQSVLDGAGNVIETCPVDQGCFAGSCIAACEAAALTGGNVGCDFSLTTPLFHAQILPPCFAAFVTNNWGKPVQVAVTHDGTSYDVRDFGRLATDNPNPASWPAIPEDGIPVGQVGVLFLSHDPLSQNGDSPLTCPIAPAISRSLGSVAGGLYTGRARAAKGTAWSITTDVPVSAYDILPFGGAASFLPSAQLLFPTTAWGTGYLAVAPPSSNHSQNVGGPHWMQVVASQDNTQVTIRPKLDLPMGDGIPTAPQGVATNFTLNAGEYLEWQFVLDSNWFDPTGTIINSDKPVALGTGNGYICYDSLTSWGGGCDSAHQMIPPVSAWGSEYIGAPFASRTSSGPESIPYRVAAAVDGTVLTYEPPIAGAPTGLDAGQSVLFETDKAFRVTSQDPDHAFYMAQLMPGEAVFGGTTQWGDEEFVNVMPPAQFLKRYVFFTDPSYQTTSLVFVREAGGEGFWADVELACLGTVTGWQTIGNSRYQVATVDLVRGGSNQGVCTNGPQTAWSNLPFGVTVWGIDDYSSYAYPAGGNAAVINDIVVD